MTQQHDAPVSITSARSSRSEDIRRREVKYLISMGIRTLCFILAIVLPSPERWFLVAAAVFLPYFAVVVANAADGRESAGPARFVREEHPQISAGPVAPKPSQHRPSESGAGERVPGEGGPDAGAKQPET
jgi:hypothetical protein